MEDYDIVVVGGGPAGMTAALYALRNGKTVLIIEKNGFGGQITYSPRVENYPGTLQMSGNEFADRFMDQLIAQGVDMEIETVVRVENEGRFKAVVTEEGSRYLCQAVILATGVKHRMLNLPGEGELVGNGISFCAVCDGDFYKDQVVCVAGGGNSALQEAIFLSGKCSQVIILQDLEMLTGEKKLSDIIESRENIKVFVNRRITGLVTENGELKGVTAADRITGEEQTVYCSGLFEAVGLVPENEAFSEIARLDSYGYFDSDESCFTMTPGVFTAGDCRAKSVRQLTTASADGAVSAIAACRYIDEMHAGVVQ